jgi:hypothetical protein
VRLFRQLSTRRLIALIVLVVGVAVGAGVGSMAALGNSAQTPPPLPLDQALHDALTAPAPDGVSARVQFTNNLFPSGALAGVPGQEGSALLSGASGRLWWSPDGRGRLELQSDAGDTQAFWGDGRLTVFDSSSNTAYTLPLPAHTAKNPSEAPTLADIDAFLKRVAEDWSVSGAEPADVAGQPAYRVTVTPQHSAGLLGSLGLAWDATHGVPLEISVHAQGQSAPVLALSVTDVSFGPVSDSDLSVTLPAGVKTVDLGSGSATESSGSSTGQQQPVTGLAAVQAAVPFSIVAPDTLVGLPRQSVRLIGGEHKGALVLYGRGLGGIALVEREAGANPDQASSLPEVALGQTTGHELATQLGTVLFFDRGGVSFVLAGSMPAAAAEAAARDLR